MDSLIITVILVFVALLIVVLFFFLKRTVLKVNQQSRDFFVDKLQVYDDLISEKEEKLEGLKKDIELKQKRLLDSEEVVENKSQIFLYDIKNIDYQDEKIFKRMKEIDQRFNIDALKIVKRFVSENFSEDTVLEYNKYNNIREKFDRSMIFKLISMRPTEQENEIKRILGDLSSLVDDYKKKHKTFEVKKFISYFDKLIEKVDPYMYVYVGSKDENYDKVHKFIRTKVDDRIYKGITIVYKGKLYDYSLK